VATTITAASVTSSAVGDAKHPIDGSH